MIKAKWGLFALLFLIYSLAAASEKVVVLTSYPQEVVTQFEAAFERAYPQYRLEILWRQSRDALAYLHGKHAPVDVYWTPAQRNFAVLSKEGAFRRLDIDLTGLPSRIGGFQISDPDGYYVASEIAGFGMAVNPGELQRLGLPLPKDWSDLSNPAYDGHVALPIPSKVGYAPMLVDTLLQGYGWEPGWNVLRQIAANAALADAGATFVSDDVGSGRMAIGATIDFFAVSAIANGKPLKFVYPEKVGYSPAHVAIFADAAQPEGARAFAGFVLSEQGQKLLFHPDIRKLPVRPSVYAGKPDGYFDPFAASLRASYSYDLASGLARQELVGALFDALVTRRHEALKTMWNAIREAERLQPDDPKLKQARTLAAWLPVSNQEADAAALQQVFSQRGKSAETEQKAAAIERQWDTAIANNYAEATLLARAVIEVRTRP